MYKFRKGDTVRLTGSEVDAVELEARLKLATRAIELLQGADPHREMEPGDLEQPLASLMTLQARLEALVNQHYLVPVTVPAYVDWLHKSQVAYFILRYRREIRAILEGSKHV